jgi:hypothetical protein
MPANPLNTDDFGGELYDLSMSEGARPLLEQVKTFIAEEVEPVTGSPSRRPMCSVSRDSTARTATLIAFLIALGDDLPCEMMLIPRTPSSGAPPDSE